MCTYSGIKHAIWRKIAATIGILLLPMLLLAQSTKIAKWEKTWNDVTQTDSVRYKAINKLVTKGYYNYKLDSALIYVNIQIDFAKARKDKRWTAKALYNKAKILRKNGSFQEMLKCYEEALSIYESLGDIRNMSSAYRQIGYVLRKQGIFGESLENYHKALDLAAKLDGYESSSSRAATLNNMGSLFLSQQDYPNALQHYQESLQLHLEIDKAKGIASNYNNISQVYFFQKEYDQAMDYLLKSLAIKKKLKDIEGLANTYQTIGNVFFEKGDIVEAKEYYQVAYRLRDSIDIKDDKALSCYRLGLIALKLKNPKRAVDWCQQGLQLSQSIGEIDGITVNSECLRLAYEDLSNADSALFYYEQHITFRDSLRNEETTKELARKEAQYIYEKEKVLLETNIAKQRLIRNIMLVVVCLMAIMFYLVLRINRIRLEKNKELQIKNEQIEKDKTIISAQTAELRAHDVMQRRFFTNISHELRTPITLITTPIEHLLNKNADQFDADAKHTHQLVYKNAQKLRNLVEEILELSQIEAGHQELNVSAVRIVDFCRQLFSAFESGANQKEISYVFQSQLLAETIALLDKKRLAKVINNLLGNALKFTSNGGQVTMKSALIEDSTLQVSISDTGRGIPKEDISKIFDRYYQVSTTAFSAEGGTGIGLSLVKELVTLMKGKLYVDSELGKGSTFTLELPLKLISAENFVEPIPSSTEEAILSGANTILHTDPVVSGNNANQQRLLIVEDNPDMQQLLYSLLAEQYECVIAKNGKEAWQLLNQHDESVKEISLILSDVMMPEMDGYTFLEKIKGDDYWRHLPVIMLTARAAEENKLKALRMGVDDYLSKPFSSDELITRAENLIQRYEERKSFNKLGIQLDFESTPSADQEWLQSLENTCREAMDKKMDITNSYLSDQLSLGERQIQRRVKSLTGLSVKQYVQEVRLQKARHLLENNVYNTIAEVAYASGFNTPKYFSKVYKKYYGKNVGDYF